MRNINALFHIEISNLTELLSDKTMTHLDPFTNDLNNNDNHLEIDQHIAVLCEHKCYHCQCSNE